MKRIIFWQMQQTMKMIQLIIFPQDNSQIQIEIEPIKHLIRRVLWKMRKILHNSSLDNSKQLIKMNFWEEEINQQPIWIQKNLIVSINIMNIIQADYRSFKIKVYIKILNFLQSLTIHFLIVFFFLLLINFFI